MKIQTLIFLLAPLAAGGALMAQTLAVNWHTVGGGGGTSTNATLALTGTVGQPAAGTLSGGGFTLVGGFWGVVAAVQTPEAPYLSVGHGETNTVFVSWPAPAPGWRLLTTANLTGTPVLWTELPPPYPTDGTNFWFAEPYPTGNRFYKLTKP